MKLISACLIGENCKYNGKNNLNDEALKLYKQGLVIPVCPEELGGLPTPRIPAERVGDLVINKEGKDVTKEFVLGAKKTLEIAQENDVTMAILQPRSPSCGCSKIYDGSFSGVLTNGNGITTELLKKNGIEVISIEDYIEKD